jgi:SRSO17 transposase
LALTAQLYLAGGLATDRARRAKVRVPTEIVFQTKPALALALLDQARAWGVPFATVVTDDGGSGDTPPSYVEPLTDRQSRPPPVAA